MDHMNYKYNLMLNMSVIFVQDILYKFVILKLIFSFSGILLESIRMVTETNKCHCVYPT